MDLAARRAQLIAELEPFGDHHERFQYVIDRAKSAPALAAELKLDAFLVEGCTSNLWLVPALEAGRCRFRCDADSLITKGVATLVCESAPKVTNETSRRAEAFTMRTGPT